MPYERLGDSQKTHYMAFKNSQAIICEPKHAQSVIHGNT